jgi:hypothetical protein
LGDCGGLAEADGLAGAAETLSASPLSQAISAKLAATTARASADVFQAGIILSSWFPALDAKLATLETKVSSARFDALGIDTHL